MIHLARDPNLRGNGWRSAPPAGQPAPGAVRAPRGHAWPFLSRPSASSRPAAPDASRPSRIDSAS